GQRGHLPRPCIGYAVNPPGRQAGADNECQREHNELGCLGREHLPDGCGDGVHRGPPSMRFNRRRARAAIRPRPPAAIAAPTTSATVATVVCAAAPHGFTVPVTSRCLSVGYVLRTGRDPFPAARRGQRPEPVAIRAAAHAAVAIGRQRGAAGVAELRLFPRALTTLVRLARRQPAAARESNEPRHQIAAVSTALSVAAPSASEAAICCWMSAAVAVGFPCSRAAT